MIEREDGDVVFECDGCGARCVTDHAVFTDALDQMKDRGWRVKKFGNVWAHFCERCKDDKEVKSWSYR